METTFKITGYQVVHADNQRDTVTLFTPVFVSDIEAYRDTLREQHEGCRYINLNYVEIINNKI